MQGSLAESLRLLRARKGLSLLAASEQLGVDRHTLRDLELGQGRTPRYPTLAKIAKGYGVPVEELLEEPALAAGKGEAPDTGQSETPPRVSKERLQEYFDDVRQDEVDYLNWMLADFWRLALPGEKPTAHFVPEDIDTNRVWQFLEHALDAGNVFEPEEAERIKLRLEVAKRDKKISELEQENAQLKEGDTRMRQENARLRQDLAEYWAEAEREGARH